jgi:hypothetical protein
MAQLIPMNLNDVIGIHVYVHACFLLLILMKNVSLTQTLNN